LLTDSTVPVPAHWNAKRDYLAGKRGIEKPPYLLPSKLIPFIPDYHSNAGADYPAWIADTGIGEQRDAVKAKEADQSLRQKTRERVQPKMGKIDIDYQKLHEAFFKFQGKPSMSKFGEAYYEGKELETDLRTKKPGELSDELVEALSIPPLAPPPWLIAMQRFGPPPSYPNLRIKGLNAPIPPG
jgi:splicing factor 3B subunit 2